LATVIALAEVMVGASMVNSDRAVTGVTAPVRVRVLAANLMPSQTAPAAEATVLEARTLSLEAAAEVGLPTRTLPGISTSPVKCIVRVG